MLETWGQGPESLMTLLEFSALLRSLPSTQAIKQGLLLAGGQKKRSGEQPSAGRWGEEGYPQIPPGLKALPGCSLHHRV